MKFKIEIDEDGYQLCCGAEESGVTDYGDEATVEIDGVTYGVVVESAEEAAEALVYQYRPEVPEVEHVEFDLGDDEDGEGNEDDDDEEDLEGEDIPA